MINIFVSENFESHCFMRNFILHEKWLLSYSTKHVLVDNSLKASSSHGAPQRRSRTDSDISTSMDDDRPPSRDYRGSLLRDDRYRHSSHRPYDTRKPAGYYDECTRSCRDHDYEDRHSRDSWERERYFDDNKDRESKDGIIEARDNRETTRDVRDNRATRDAREAREIRERDNKDKKDYDNYLKVLNALFFSYQFHYYHAYQCNNIFTRSEISKFQIIYLMMLSLYYMFLAGTCCKLFPQLFNFLFSYVRP